MTEPINAFAAWLNTTMQSRGISQAALAREVGVADAQISRWRRGQVVPTVRYLQRLSERFGVPRATLDRLAGYPVAEPVGDPDASDGDPEEVAERLAYQAWYGHLLETKVPRPMWPAYAMACEALADALTASFRTALSKVPPEALERAAVTRGEDTSPPARRVGFGP
jgi:transcriptional regulator with XRE-family HTH domain